MPGTHRATSGPRGKNDPGDENPGTLAGNRSGRISETGLFSLTADPEKIIADMQD